MSQECVLDSADGLHPASHTLPEGGTVRSRPSRLCLPGLKGKTVRVRNLALWLSIVAHAAVIGVLCTAKLATELPEPPTLVEVEFVEIPGPKGGGGSPAPALPAPKGQAAPAQASQAVPLPDPTSRQTAQPAISAAQVSGMAAASSQGAVAGGSGGGSGGGQSTGVGTSVGSGTGQGGIAVDRMPIPVRQPKPRYPMSARRMGQSGQVLLRLFVDQEGAVREVNVVRAEPAGVFDEAAVEAARKWQFSPAMSRGATVGMWMTLPVRFSLEDR
ncbi:MAG: energy transducer TonB [Humidesulfovibrio sp.]